LKKPIARTIFFLIPFSNENLDNMLLSELVEILWMKRSEVFFLLVLGFWLARGFVNSAKLDDVRT